MVSAKRKIVDTKRFILQTEHLFADQYFHIYNARLLAARDALINRSRYRWGDDIKNVPLEQLNISLGNTEVFVIGTLFKSMPHQPSILRELEENIMTPKDLTVNFTSDEDSLVLHETDENVQLVGDIDVHGHVTGIPVSLKGRQLDGGAKFSVTDICYAGPNLEIYRMPPAEKRDKFSDNVLIVSGMEFCLEDLKEESSFIKGLVKLRDFVNNEDSSIVKVIIAGNSVAPCYTKTKTEIIGTFQSNDYKSIHEVFRTFDKYIFTLAQSGADITVMPGKNDPTSFLLPQQPFHQNILPKSGPIKNVQPVTNPCLLDFKDRLILGTSGENVDAILKYSKIEFSTTALKNTLEWGHIAPSAPDNISCLPFKDRDPFLFDFVPDVYFAGNQPEYAVTTYSCETKDKIQLISVPKFREKLQGILVNLSNLDVECVYFN